MYSVLCGQITTLANDVLKMVQETDALIDDLPGLDKTEMYVVAHYTQQDEVDIVLSSAWVCVAVVGNRWRSYDDCRFRVKRRLRRFVKSPRKQVATFDCVYQCSVYNLLMVCCCAWLVSIAERWMDRARDSLRVISETRLRR